MHAMFFAIPPARVQSTSNHPGHVWFLAPAPRLSAPFTRSCICRVLISGSLPSNQPGAAGKYFNSSKVDLALSSLAEGCNHYYGFARDTTLPQVCYRF